MVKRYLKLYRLLIGAKIQSQMQYRASFILEFIGAIFSSGVDFAAILVVFGHISSLAGWNFQEVALLYGISSLAFAMCELFFSGFDYFPGMIRTGQFDSVLIRPVPDFFQVLCSEFVMRKLGRALQGLAAAIYAVSGLHDRFSPTDYFILISAVITGSMIYGFLFMVQGTMAFWTVESLEIFNILTYGGNEMLSHPLDIYGKWIRRLFIYVIPMAFLNYIPAAAILDKPIVTSLPYSVVWLLPFIGPFLLLIGWRIWRFGVGHYQSTGS